MQADNDPPEVANQTVNLSEDQSASVTVNATDVDGDALTYEITTLPVNGVAQINGNEITFQPNQDFNGTDELEVTVSDGSSSVVSTIMWEIAPVNDAPVSVSASYSASAGETLTVTLEASDVDGDPLAYLVLTPPVNGTLTGEPPSLIYTPSATFSGSDSFTFNVSDAESDSNTATVEFDIVRTNASPVFDAPEQQVLTAGDALSVQLTATDADNDPLQYALVSSQGGLSIDSDTGIVEWQTTESSAGANEIAVSVSDGIA